MLGYTLTLLVVLLGLFSKLNASTSDECERTLRYISPFIGTTGAGYAGGQGSPAAQMPFGAMRIGPDTTNNTLNLGYRHASGYNWADDNIRAFSHTRLVNAGVTDLGNFGVMPTNRRGIKDNIRAALTSDLWISHYVKKSESAKPGSYSVYMDSIDVQADILTFDKFAGVHKYTWNPTEKYDSTSKTTDNIPGMVIDICHAASKSLEKDGACLSANLAIQPDKRSFQADVLFRGSLSGRGASDGVNVFAFGALINPDDIKNPILLDDWLVCTGDKNCDVVSGIPSIRKDSEPTVFSGSSGKLLSHVRFLNKGDSADPFSIELVMGLSFISSDQAKANLAAALSKNSAVAPTSNPSPVRDGVSYFKAMQAQVKSEWCNALSTLQLQDDFPASSMEGVTFPDKPELPDIPFDKFQRDFLTIAYSSLYRTLLSPTQYTEANGEYFGMDRITHNAKSERQAAGMVEIAGPASFEYFSDLSLWDTFRTQHPWLLLSRPDVAIGTVRSMGEMSKHANRFPKWVLASVESGCMIGIHGLAVVVEAIEAGYGAAFDVATIQKVAINQSTNVDATDRRDLQRYLTSGYVSLEAADNAASLTLSYAFDDHSLGVISEYVGDSANANSSYSRAKNYKTIWSNKQEIMCPRLADGSFSCPLDSIGPKSWGYYTEGDAEHWRWFVPQDIEGLISLFATTKRFESVLENFFAQHLPQYYKLGEAIPNAYYWSGNEVDLLTPFMFNYANCTRTQYWTRKTLYLHYNSMPNGLPGNDDYGSMSANVIFTSLGFYPLAGTSKFFITSPRVSSARVSLGLSSGAAIEVVTYNNSPDNVFVEKLLLNGVEVTSPSVDRSVLTGQFTQQEFDSISPLPLDDVRRAAPAKGVKLEFFMTNSAKSGLCAAY